jgi:hypothetical protein
MRTAAPRDRRDNDTLLPGAGTFAAALVLAALTAGFPWQPAAAQAVPCTAIADDAERLACYDRALRATQAPAIATPAAVPTTPAAQAAGASAAPSATAAAPVSATAAASAASTPSATPAAPAAAPAPSTAAAAPAAQREDAEQVVSIVIVGVRTLPGRETTFTAQDGATWVQTDSQRVAGLPETPFDAQIKPGAMGSKFLVPKDRGRAIRVRLAAP